MTTIAVMQPYFVPYAGYFRLFAAADVFVAFDCVQFPRRGWVHRNRFETGPGDSDWLTLPVSKCDRSTRIADLEFPADAEDQLGRAVRRFPLLAAAWGRPPPVLEHVKRLGAGTVADYLCTQLAGITALLGLERPLVRSSTLGISPELHGQARVLAIASKLGATRYVNSPGGRELYDHGEFRDHGIELSFLERYSAAPASILSLLLTAEPAEIAALIRRETVFAA